MDDRSVLHPLRRDPCVTFVRGDNARPWDADGRMYVDTMSGSAGPALVGHARDEDVERKLEPVADVAGFIDERVHGRVLAHA